MSLHAFLFLYYFFNKDFANGNEAKKQTYSGTFIVVAPDDFRSDTPYAVSVNLLKDAENVEVDLKIVATNKKNATAASALEKSFKTNEPKIITLELEKNFDFVSGDNYQLRVKGISTTDKKVLFENRRMILFNVVSFPIFIQTDKTVYKPGATVKFRVMAIKIDLTPYEGSAIVWIEDPQSNIIANYSELKFDHGVIGKNNELTFELSDEPLLGSWRICVLVKGKETSKSFDVVKHEKNLFQNFPSQFRGEPLTNTEINASIYRSVNCDDKTMSMSKVSYGRFYPGEPYSILISIICINGSTYLPSNADLVYLAANYELIVNGTNQEITEYHKTSFNKTGTALLTFNTLKNTKSMFLRGRFVPNQKEISNIPKFEDSWWFEGLRSEDTVRKISSPTSNYLIIKKEPNETTFSIGDEASFQVSIIQATDVPYITAEVVSRSSVVFAKTFPVANGAVSVRIPISYKMTPKAEIIVHGMKTTNKEILVDSYGIKVKGLLRNQVTVSADPKRTEPHGNVTFTVHASPSSYIGLLATAELAVHKKKKNERNNDVSQSDIENVVSQFDWETHGYCPVRMSKRYKRSLIDCEGFGAVITASDAEGIFDNAGVVVLTDAFVYSDIAYHAARNKRSRIDNTVPEENLKGKPDFLLALNNDPIAVRERLLETWIWSDAYTGPNGKTVLVAQAPDTISSYQISAFAMHDTDGLSIASESANVEVVKEFFIQIDLPYSMKRGEQLALKVLIFNYKLEERIVSVILVQDTQSGFEFVNTANANNRTKGILGTKQIKVDGKGDSSVVYFPIRPTKLGQVKIVVKAFGQDVSDAVEQNLFVEAEGYPLFHYKPFVIDLTKSSSWFNSTHLDFPYKTVSGSQAATVSFSGDIMAPLLSNIGNLIQMPYGCGEQHMLNFVSNIILYKYLTATKRLTPKIESNLRSAMEMGYQHALTYQHSDYSFSAFGLFDDRSSTWLTAYFAKSFQQASPYILIDAVNFNKSFDFLSLKLKDDGGFQDIGVVHDRKLDAGDDGDNVVLSAFVHIAFLVNKKEYPSTLEYLESSLDFTNDSYTLSILCYALTLSKTSTKADECLTKLEKLAVKKDATIHWSKGVEKIGVKKPVWWSRPNPTDVETTAYVLLTYVLKGQMDKAFPLSRWLLEQQNAYGGFSTSQDTIVALQALGEFAEKTYSDKTNVVITVENGGVSHEITIKPENLLIQQNYQIPNVEKSINIKPSGKGVVYGQISWQHNVERLENIKPFACGKQVNQNTVDDLTLTLCCKYNFDKKSSMAVIEVEVPSGFGIEEQELNILTSIAQLQRVETTFGDMRANIYFNFLDENLVCFNVSSKRLYGIVDQKPAKIKLYDYYNPSDRIEFDYEVVNKGKLTDFCGLNC